MGKTFISLVLGFAAIAGLLVYQAMDGGTSEVLLPSEVLAKAGSAPLTRIRVAGKVSAAEINYSVQPTFELKFSIGDPGKGEIVKGPMIPVVYNGIKPDMFNSGRDVIIDGEFAGGVLIAQKLLTQCPSKYEPPSPEKMYPQAATGSRQ